MDDRRTSRATLPACNPRSVRCRGSRGGGRSAVAVGLLLTLLGVVTGCGDDEPAGTTALSTGSGGAGGAGGAGGEGGAGGAPLVNGCDPAGAEAAGPGGAEIVTVALAYTPRCLRVSPGAAVTFASDFATHPLVGGRIEGGMEVPEPSSPIAPTATGDTASFVLSSPGTFGFYCDFHGLAGMNGAIFVE